MDMNKKKNQAYLCVRNRFKYVLFESESDFIDSKETVALPGPVFSDVYELN